MMKKLWIWGLISMIIAAAACAPKLVWKTEPNTAEVRNSHFEARISPIYLLDGYKGFLITLDNKAGKEIAIDWKKSQYIRDGEQKGGFLFGEMRDEAAKEKPLEKVAAGSRISTEIFPADLGYFSTIAKSTLYRPMPPGQNGVLLVVRINGREIEERLVLRVLQETEK